MIVKGFLCSGPGGDLAHRMTLRGQCKMTILGAAMRKIVPLCFGVLKRQTPYLPFLPQNA
jgi:hypothetical protein